MDNIVIKVGDIVSLNSGGPKMTVINSPSDNGEGEIDCGYFGLNETYTAVDNVPIAAVRIVA